MSIFTCHNTSSSLEPGPVVVVVVAVMGRGKSFPSRMYKKCKTQSGIKSYYPLRKSVLIYFDSVVFPSPHKCHGTIQYTEPKYSAVTIRRSGLSAHRPKVPRQPLNGYVSRFRGIPPLLMASTHAHGDPSGYIIHVLFRNTAFLVDDFFLFH
jgi:hypothetical protein